MNTLIIILLQFFIIEGAVITIIIKIINSNLIINYYYYLYLRTQVFLFLEFFTCIKEMPSFVAVESTSYCFTL